MSVNYNPKIVTDGLVLCLDAGNAKSYPGTGTTWFDLSGNNVHATLFNSPAYISSGYFILNGSNQYARCLLPETLVGFSPNTFTYIVWVYPTQIGAWNTLIDQDNDDWLFVLNNGSICSYDPNFNSGILADVNQWQQLVMSHTHLGPVKLYKNGSLIYTSLDNATQHTTTYFGIGAGVTLSDADEFFAGRMSHICIYNRAITDIEVSQNFNAVRGRFGI